ncbi:sensor domain-containing diguanylate cyclase [Lichenibacterium dinghuense]|uniref:sensor domain-containing diguanylate cyclase n=1 Tax=Lichenibacterium dinghuense TaxID=2895977 RepID=UPI001F38FF4D|nr:sensor domain-containing diguanylate cyclase [Lichenibacterium sp. 6Y81]
MPADMTPHLRAAFRLLSPGTAPRRGLFLSISLAVVAIVAVFAVVIVDARADARRSAEAAEVNLATALARDMDRNVELLDLSIQAARDSWADPRVRALDPELRQLVLFDHSASARYIDAILVVDRDGTVLADSRSTAPAARDFRDADFFAAQQAGDAGLFIGRPVRAPGKGEWHIAFSRRITADDGSFAGMAVGFLNLGYLTETYKHLPLGDGSILQLLNADGTLLVREPEARGTVGRSFKNSPVFRLMDGPESGTFEATSTVDGRPRLFAYRRVGALPLIQVVAEGTDAVFAGWRAKALALGAVVAVLCSGILALLFGLKGELQSRVAAERRLDVLASTDPLTGLANRRRFFERAEARCAEAARGGLPLSLVMLDADHFKSFNDRYGHAAGDRALVALARAIEGEVRGGIDVAARYGGEEFVLLLPGLDGTAALAVAEAIRAAVAGLALPHDRAPAGIVTVSAGLASVGPGMPAELRALVEGADAELYRSKRDGRNRSSGGGRLLARYPRPEALSA